MRKTTFLKRIYWQVRPWMAVLFMTVIMAVFYMLYNSI